jgi:hypothetical protein
MAGGNKSNSPKAKKRKLQLQARAKVESAERKNRRGYQGGQPRSGFAG